MVHDATTEKTLIHCMSQMGNTKDKLIELLLTICNSYSTHYFAVSFFLSVDRFDL